MSESEIREQPMPRFEPGPDRSRLGFIEAVSSCFGFLCADFGFGLAEQCSTLARFESDRVVVHVFHGRGSYELGVEIGLRSADADAVRYSLREVIKLDHDPVAVGYGGFQASSVDSVSRLVPMLSELTQRYAPAALRGDPAVFDQLAVQRTRESRELTDSYVAEAIRERANDAWERGDFAAVIRAYAELDALSSVEMTRSETARLGYAQRRLEET